MAKLDMRLPVFLFAAGLGTRMGEMVKDRPKPLIEVAGQPLIDHAIALTEMADVGQRVINVHYYGEMVRDHIADKNILVSDETERLLETGGGLRKALPLLDSDVVITLNTDAVWQGGNPISLLLQHWRDDMEALLLLVPPERCYGHIGGGDFEMTDEGRLLRPGTLTYTGLQILRTDRLAHVPDIAFSLNVIWNEMAAAGGLYGVCFDGDWCDVGRPQSIAIAEEMLQAAARV